MRRMTLCASCERHVYESEPACPFCGSAAERLPPGSTVRGRLSRAAGHAARAAIVAGAVACGSSSEVATDAGVDAAVAEDASSPDGGVVEDAGSPTDAAPEDAAVADASSAGDGGDVDADVPAPLYGGIFPDPRKRAVV